MHVLPQRSPKLMVQQQHQAPTLASSDIANVAMVDSPCSTVAVATHDSDSSEVVPATHLPERSGSDTTQNKQQFASTSRRFGPPTRGASTLSKQIMNRMALRHTPDEHRGSDTPPSVGSEPAPDRPAAVAGRNFRVLKKTRSTPDHYGPKSPSSPHQTVVKLIHQNSGESTLTAVTLRNPNDGYETSLNSESPTTFRRDSDDQFDLCQL